MWGGGTKGGRGAHRVLPFVCPHAGRVAFQKGKVHFTKAQPTFQGSRGGVDSLAPTRSWGPAATQQRPWKAQARNILAEELSLSNEKMEACARWRVGRRLRASISERRGFPWGLESIADQNTVRNRGESWGS